jgi:hypothetical protein
MKCRLVTNIEGSPKEENERAKLSPILDILVPAMQVWKWTNTSPSQKYG